ncbi:PepSY-associated TM helix domain-containing protein [Paracoccus sp. p1-h21]
MSYATNGSQDPAASLTANKYYFLAWRWHFYAGLYVAPFLIMLAVTGLAMMWISWGAGIADERLAIPAGQAPQAVSTLQAAAEATLPGSQAFQYVEPLAADRVAVIAVQSGDTKTGIALNPYTAQVVHSFPWRGGWYNFLDDIHGSLLIGTIGDRLVEIAASLGILLIVTGLYLHWPRNGNGWRKTLLPQTRATGRNLWKSLHGVIGLWMAPVLLIFLLSGLSWAGIWGGKLVQAWNTFPAEKWDAPLSDKTHSDLNRAPSAEVPWAIELTPMPVSGSPAGQAAISGPVTADNVTAFARQLGFDGRFQLHFPKTEDGVWTISHDSMSNDGPNPADDRTLHIDRFTGNVLADLRYADYSPYAKAMAWGIAFHEGDLGVWNLTLNTAFCLSVIFISLSGLVMWWKRRPSRAARLAAPPKPANLPLWKTASALVVVLGVLFPMAGLAILLALAVDLTLLRAVPPLKRAMS